MTQRLNLAVVFPSALLLLALSFPATAQRKNDVTSAPFSPMPYQVGERLTYNISFSSFISAAHAELRVMARGNFFDREGIQLRAHVETTGVVSAALFAIDNDYFTYIDPQNGLPYRTQQIVREASQTSDAFRDFNGGSFDFLSALYRLRALPLAEGSSYRFVVRGADSREYQAELRVKGRETLKTNVGSFDTLVSEIDVKNDSTLDNYNLHIYFSDDQKHIPVLITAKHKAGHVRAELAGSDLVAPPPNTAKPSATPTAVLPAVTPSTSGPTSNNVPLSGLPFAVGEQLTYQVYLGNVSQVAATATFQVKARGRFFERDGLSLTTRAQTTNAIQRLFFANDQINTFISQQTLLPYRVEMNLIEGRRRLNQTLTINQDHGSATTEKGVRIEIPVGTHDYLSFFYMVRTLNLMPPKQSAVSMLVENKPKIIFIDALKKEVIRLGNQDVPAIQISIKTDDSQPDKYQLRAWISDDRRRLPLRLTAQTAIGQVRADLAIIPLSSQ